MEDTEAKQAPSPSPLVSFSNASFGFGFGAAPGPPPPPPPPAVEVLLSEVVLLRFLFLLARLRVLSGARFDSHFLRLAGIASRGRRLGARGG
jgi:hypothetical protein